MHHQRRRLRQLTCSPIHAIECSRAIGCQKICSALSRKVGVRLCRPTVGRRCQLRSTWWSVSARLASFSAGTLTVKGFAKPVRTYSVVGLYDDLAEQGRIILRDQAGLALKIDQDKLTKKGKAEAIKALEEAVAQLKG